MVNNPGDADFMLHEGQLVSVLWQCQVLTCVEHFVTLRIIDISQKNTLVITSSGGNNMVMVNNQGDADFLCFMKVNWCLYYANYMSSHVWNIL